MNSQEKKVIKASDQVIKWADIEQPTLVVKEHNRIMNFSLQMTMIFGQKHTIAP